MTRWLVDASNVIGSRPDGWWRDRAGATERLLEALERFAAESGDEVVAVLDAGPSSLAGRRGALAGRVRALGASVEGARGFRDRSGVD